MVMEFTSSLAVGQMAAVASGSVTTLALSPRLFNMDVGMEGTARTDGFTLVDGTAAVEKFVAIRAHQFADSIGVWIGDAFGKVGGLVAIYGPAAFAIDGSTIFAGAGFFLGSIDSSPPPKTLPAFIKDIVTRETASIQNAQAAIEVVRKYFADEMTEEEECGDKVCDSSAEQEVQLAVALCWLVDNRNSKDAFDLLTKRCAGPDINDALVEIAKLGKRSAFYALAAKVENGDTDAAYSLPQLMNVDNVSGVEELMRALDVTELVRAIIIPLEESLLHSDFSQEDVPPADRYIDGILNADKETPADNPPFVGIGKKDTTKNSPDQWSFIFRNVGEISDEVNVLFPYIIVGNEGATMALALLIRKDPSLFGFIVQEAASLSREKMPDEKNENIKVLVEFIVRELKKQLRRKRLGKL